MPRLQHDVGEGRTEQQKRVLVRETKRVVHGTIDASVECVSTP